jgi:hypothetical protein
MNENKTFIEALDLAMQAKGFAKSSDLPRIDFVEIKSIDAQKLNCSVLSMINQGEYLVDVVIDEKKDTVKFFPKIGSKAYVFILNENRFFLNYEQIEFLEIGDGSKEMGVIKIKEQQDEINNKLTSKLNELISKFNDLLTNYKTHNHTHPQGPTTGLIVPYTGANQVDAEQIAKSNYELTKILKIKYE